MYPPGETRDQRHEITRRALAEAVREHMVARRLRQTKVALGTGISRSFLRSILRADKGCSLFVFLELSDGIGADPGDLLSDVLKRRELLRTHR